MRCRNFGMIWKKEQRDETPYGMMVSMKTPITGKPTFREPGEESTPFIANEDHQQERHLVAWELLRHIVKSDIVAGHGVVLV